MIVVKSSSLFDLSAAGLPHFSGRRFEFNISPLNFSVSGLSNTYQRWVERKVLVLLLLAIIPALLIDYSKLVVNVYRLAVMLPILIYCVSRPSLLNEINNNSSALLFYFFWLYCFLSIIWGGYSEVNINLLGRGLATYVLLILVFILSKSGQSKDQLQYLKNVCVGFGIVSLFVIFYQRKGVSFNFSVFDHHVFVSWLAASLAVIVLLEKYPVVIKVVLLSGLFYCIMLSRGRGGVLIFSFSLLSLLVYSLFDNGLALKIKESILLAFAALFLALMAMLVWEYEAFMAFINKGLSSRDKVWAACAGAITTGPSILWFGHGLNVDVNNLLGSRRFNHCHSLYENTVLYTGLFGLFILLSLFISTLKKGFRYFSDQPWPHLMLGFMVAFLVDGNRVFVYPSAFMLCFLLPFFICMFGREFNATELN